MAFWLIYLIIKKARIAIGKYTPAPVGYLSNIALAIINSVRNLYKSEILSNITGAIYNTIGTYYKQEITSDITLNITTTPKTHHKTNIQSSINLNIECGITTSDET